MLMNKLVVIDYELLLQSLNSEKKVNMKEKNKKAAVREPNE